MGALSDKLEVLDTIWKHRERVIEYVVDGGDRPMPGDAYLAQLAAFADSVRAGEAYPRVCGYMHVPLCISRCFYCNCTCKRISGQDEIQAHHEALLREIDLVGPLFEGVPLSAMYVGGGTPNVLKPGQMDEMLSRFFSHFERGPDFHFGFEMSPQGTTAAKAKIIASHGVDRVSFGVQSMNSEVLSAVSRGHQTHEMVRRAMDAIREAGIEAINVDMIAGLPKESDESFLAGLDEIISYEPDSVTVYRLFTELSPLIQYGFDLDPASRDKRERQLKLAVEKLYPDRPAPGADLYAVGRHLTETTATRNMYETMRQDMAATTVGMGLGSETRIHGRIVSRYDPDFDRYVGNLEQGKMPDVSARPITEGIEMGQLVGNNLDRHELSLDRFREVFGRDLFETYPDELGWLDERGWLERENGVLRRAALSGEDARYGAFMVNALFLPAEALSRALAQMEREEVRSLSTPGLADRKQRAPGRHAVEGVEATHAIHLLRKCNLSCTTCPWADSFDGSEVPDSELEETLTAVERSRAHRVDYVGGEPTLDAKRLVRTVKRLRKSGVREQVLWTNARMLRYDKLARALTDAGLTRVVVSVHGADAAVHDDATRVPGAFEDLVEGVRTLLATGFDAITIRFVLAPRLAERFGDVARFFQELGVKSFLLEYLDDGQLDVGIMSDFYQVVSAHRLEVDFYRRGQARAAVRSPIALPVVT